MVISNSCKGHGVSPADFKVLLKMIEIAQFSEGVFRTYVQHWT